MGLDAGDVRVTATVTLTLDDDGAYGLRAALAAVTPGVGGADRDRVIAEARRICAYSNALKGLATVTAA